MNAETFSAGLAHKLFLTAEAQGYTPALMNQLAENPTLLAGFLRVQQGLAEIVPTPILKFIATITIAARTAMFVPKKSYVINTKPGSHVKIGYVDSDFTAWFGEKAEEPTAETKLRYHVLTRPSAFAPAMKEIRDGGVATKTTPGELFSMLEKQPDGPKSDAGPLLTNGYANLFEMDDVNGVPRLVDARWYDAYAGWHVYAFDASHPSQWRGGYQLFSRDSR